MENCIKMGFMIEGTPAKLERLLHEMPESGHGNVVEQSRGLEDNRIVGRYVVVSHVMPGQSPGTQGVLKSCYLRDSWHIKGRYVGQEDVPKTLDLGGPHQLVI